MLSDGQAEAYKDEVFETVDFRLTAFSSNAPKTIVGVKLPPAQSKALRKDFKKLESKRIERARIYKRYQQLEAARDNPGGKERSDRFSASHVAEINEFFAYPKRMRKLYLDKV
mgnify:CR=1 FL=1